MSEESRHRLARRTLLGVVGAAGVAACAPDLGSGTPSGTGTTSAQTPTGTGSTSAASNSSASPGSGAPTSQAPNQGRGLSMVMSGDLLWHNTLWMQAADDHRRTGKGETYDFDPMFAMMTPIISGADLSIAHNEVPFAKPGNRPSGYPSFAAPHQIAAWMKTMGWDLATTASNHSIDQGFAGLVRTHDLLTRAGIGVVGTYPSLEVKRKPVIIERKGVKVSVVSGTYDLNGLVPPAGKEWCVDMWDVDRMLAEARAARAAGADIVLAHLHGGDEYQTRPNADQVRRATRLAKSPDIDLIFGEHVHVVQPITTIKDTWVIYGMGNMVAQHLVTVPRGYEGITVRFTWAEADEPLPGKVGRFRVSKAEYLPTLVTSYRSDGGARLYPVHQALREGTGDAARLRLALDRTRRAVRSLNPPKELIEV